MALVVSRVFTDSKPGNKMRWVRGILDTTENVLIINMYRSPNATEDSHHHTQKFPVKDVPQNRRSILHWLQNKASIGEITVREA
jgi:hypothetical protein